MDLQCLRLKTRAEQFLESGNWGSTVKEIQAQNVIKMPRIVQAILFLLGYRREDVCEPNSNRLFWKSARQHLNSEFVQKMIEYQIRDQKSDAFTGYQTINFCEKLIADYN